ncbi:rod outer segment membrane protein 1a [Clupea harengus]|uniref:Rod outer segment membrane protein 1a n=1 Tax=Clupea harengus TaxID=7950 RepID=A0A6P3W5L1_CLUHA|nr:rod outer segment membrane protein 1a [Clupea harengus]
MVLMKMKFSFQKRVKLAQSLWLLSWMATVAGSITFCLGCFLKIELRKRAEVMGNTDIYIVPHTLMIVGLGGLGINYFAGRICQDALDPSRFPQWKTFLKPYFGASMFVTFLMFMAMLMSFIMKGSLESSLLIGLRKGIRFYKDTDTPGRCFQKQSIDRLQMDFQCCGNDDYRDWFEVQWISNRYLDLSTKDVKDRIKSNVDGRYLLDGVPFSCCNPSSPRPCIQYQLTNDTAHFSYEHQTEELNLYLRGCREALVSYYGGLMNTIGVIVLSVLLVQGSVLASLRYLQTSLEALEGQADAEAESEGYLLEKSVKETVMEWLEPVLKLLQLNQVASEEGDAAPA